MKKNNIADLTRGPVLKQLVTLVIPLFITNLVQQLFGTADMLIIGNLSQNSETALAAVSAPSIICSTFLTLLIAMAVGNNVLCANLVGAGMREELRRVMHSSLVLGLILGGLLVAVGLPLAPVMLTMTHCPESILPEASLYMRMIFIGQIPLILFNFGAAILRAHGDTRRPMQILLISGGLKVLFNLLFVGPCRLEVFGVGLATVLSNLLSCIAVLWLLFSPSDPNRMCWRELRLSPKETLRILRVGFPMGVNDTLFNFTSVIVQNSVNQFGAATIAGNGVASNLTAFIYVFLNSFHHAIVTFAGQNYGAKCFNRIREIFWKGLGLLLVILVITALIATFFASSLLSLYDSDPAVVAAGRPQLIIFAWGFLINAIPTLLTSCLFGMGRTGSTSFLNMLCNTLPRIFWIGVLLPHWNNLWFLYLCYPASWIVNTAVGFLFFAAVFRKEKKRLVGEG